MELGIGLPASVPGTSGATVLEWARRSEQRGFSTLGITDRIVYDNYEPLVTLAAAAAVTERIRLTTSILLAPLRTNHMLFAKQVASVDRLSGGRLVLGIGVGRRANDYTECGLPYERRGAELDALLEQVTDVWDGDTPGIGPAPSSPGGPALMFGGDSPAALRRMAKYGRGWIAGGGFGDVFRAGSAAARQAWADAGREGSPRLLALSYFALGPNARADADSYLKDYYAFVGPFADQIAAAALTTADQVTQRVAEFAQAGCDELILLPCSGDGREVDRLGDALGL
jgi:alkanesulfonate monooxygenase SsuD/methylene tetrahydromethanopterin reductase-like flavin-dependent oxidoreductase (luciferase family)